MDPLFVISLVLSGIEEEKGGGELFSFLFILTDGKIEKRSPKGREGCTKKNQIF
jgi:hypothetical protein